MVAGEARLVEGVRNGFQGCGGGAAAIAERGVGAVGGHENAAGQIAINAVAVGVGENAVGNVGRGGWRALVLAPVAEVAVEVVPAGQTAVEDAEG